jgi:hypothetical protein
MYDLNHVILIMAAEPPRGAKFLQAELLSLSIDQ